MKIFINLLSLALALAALWLYLGVRKCLNRHGEEELEQHRQWLMGRMRVICILTITASLLGLVRLFL